ncbi:hypothetical protein MMYC01_207505, partial [Madurella mycetomatis]
ELWATYVGIFLCGDEYLPIDTLVRYHNWAASLTLTQDKSDPASPPHTIPVFPQLVAICKLKPGSQHSLMGTSTFLEIVSQWHCKDPRDKIFALFGIFRMNLSPDYTMPVADVYAAWAVNSHQDLPLGSLLFYSGIGLYPRTLGNHNLASWQPDFELLGGQVKKNDIYYAYRYSDANQPVRFQATVSPTRCFTCFGVRVANVREVATKAAKRMVENAADPRGWDKGPTPTSIIPVLKYLVDNREQFWTHAYHERGSLLHAFVETGFECMADGAPTTPPTPTLTADILRAFTPYNLSLRVRLLESTYFPTEILDELTGSHPSEELWECLADFPGNSHEDELSPELIEILFEFLTRLEIFSFSKSLFYTDGGLLGAGPPGVEAHDQVYLVHGCSLPVLLREVEGKLRHVGVCYIAGLSGVDSFRILKERESDVRELNLV